MSPRLFKGLVCGVLGMLGAVPIGMREPSAFALSLMAYSPIKMTIDEVSASGQLHVEDRPDRFLLKKGNELILVIPKYEEWGDNGLAIRHKEDLYGAFQTAHTIELRTETPNMLLCHHAQRGCDSQIRTSVPGVTIQHVDVAGLVRAAGVTDEAVKTTLLEFSLRGAVDGDAFTMRGRIVHDNTEASRAEHAKRAAELLRQWQERDQERP